MTRSLEAQLKHLLILTGLLLAATIATAATYTWVGGGNNNAFSNSVNWSPASPAGGPGSGDVGNIGGSHTCGVYTASMMVRGAIITFSDTAALVGIGSSNASFKGQITFNDRSRMLMSQLNLTNAVLNWNSTDAWTTAGTNNSIRFQVSANAANTNTLINMSAGLWDLTGSTNSYCFLMRAGTFYMTGGTIVSDKRFYLGYTTGYPVVFNLGGNGTVYTDNLTLMSNTVLNVAGHGHVFANSFTAQGNSKLNYQGLNSALYLAGLYQYTNLAKVVASGNIQINGTNVLDSSYFVYAHVSLQGKDWTKVTVLPTGSISFPSVDASTLDGKILCGYQAWFTTLNDDGSMPAWIHWVYDYDHLNLPNGTNSRVEMYPDLSEFHGEELFPTAMTIGGQTAYLYSGMLYKTVRRHVRWMQEYGIDGAFAQRFITTESGGDTVYKAHILNALRGVKAGCEEYGRVFGVMYDVSGMTPESDWWGSMTNDWISLVNSGIVGSDRYMKHNGKPVVAIWGFGFKDNPHGPTNPAVALAAINWFKTDAPLKYRATVLGGVPGQWRTRNGDSFTQAAWSNVYHSFDVLMPWTVGRYTNNATADTWKTTRISPDLTEANTYGIGYCPVIFPGFSWYNLTGGTSPKNQIPRNGGNFFWRQAYNAKSAGCNMLFIAMFDEVDEGTAIYKVAPIAAQVPDQGYWLTLNAEGYSLPSDWYLRLAYEAGRMFRGEIALTPMMPTTPGPLITSRGTPISWLESYGLLKEGFESGDIGDSDSDWVPAWAEYLDGTVPTNPSSCLLRLNIALGCTNSVVLSWAGMAGRLYSIYSSQDIRDGMNGTTSYTDVPGSNGWMSCMFSVTNSFKSFYRLKIRYAP